MHACTISPTVRYIEYIVKRWGTWPAQTITFSVPWKLSVYIWYLVFQWSPKDLRGTSESKALDPQGSS